MTAEETKEETEVSASFSAVTQATEEEEIDVAASSLTATTVKEMEKRRS